MIKAQTKGFITRGMDDEKGLKFQSLSVKTGKQTSYLSLHIEEETRKKYAQYLIKGQQVEVDGNISITANEGYKNVVFWVKTIKFLFTPEEVAKRNADLAAGIKPEIKTKQDQPATVKTPGIETPAQEQVVEVQVGENASPVEVKESAIEIPHSDIKMEPEVANEQPNIPVGTEIVIEETPNGGTQSKFKPLDEEKEEKELTEEEILAQFSEEDE